MDKKLIFGYGSLISKDSLMATSPNATEVQPAYIKGFIRDFSFWDALGYTETNLDLAGIPMCSLNVREAGRKNRVNGVIFIVDSEDYKALLVRERGQDPLTTVAYDYKTDKKIGECVVFASKKLSGSFDFGNPAQLRYLHVALEASRKISNQFYKDFINSTYIGDSLLAEHPELFL